MLILKYSYITSEAGDNGTSSLQTHNERGDTMVRNFRSEDTGKDVKTSDGHTVGTVEETMQSKAQVKPDESVPRSIRRRLGWPEDFEEESYEISQSQVSEITEHEVHLKQDL